MKKLIFIFIVNILIFLLSFSCSWYSNYKDTDRRVEAIEDNLNYQINQIRRPSKHEQKRVLDVRRESYLGVRRKTDLIPDNFYDRVIFIKPDKISLWEFAEYIKNAYGINVNISSELYDTADIETEGGQQSAGDSNARTFAVKYRGGTIKELLDTVCAKTGTNWHYDAKRGVVISLFETRVFELHALPGSMGSQASINSSAKTSDEGSSVSGESETSYLAQGVSIWTSVQESVQNMLSKSGTVVVAEATGTITVTDYPETIKRVGEFIAAQNEQLTRQVFVNVEVFTVTLSSDDEFGIDWAAIRTELARQFQSALEFSSFGPSISEDAGRLTFSVLDNGRTEIDGSKWFVKALSKQGKVSLVTSSTVATMSGRPAPVQIGSRISYLKEVSTTVSDGGNTSSLMPGEINTGFHMEILPRVLIHDLIMQLNISMSQLVSMGTVSSGEVSIQTPEINTRNFLQQIKMSANQTLIVSGFRQVGNDVVNQGTGDTHIWLAGGGMKTGRHRDIVIILITPILDDRDFKVPQWHQSDR